jgi:hypothetical protein
MGFCSGVFRLIFGHGHPVITIRILLNFSVPLEKCRINMSLFKLQHADERTDRHTRSKADKFSFFTLRFLGVEVDCQKAACNKYNNIKNNSPSLFKRVGHISNFKSQWLLRELPNLTLKIVRPAHTVYLFILYRSQINSEYFPLQRLLVGFCNRDGIFTEQ